MGKIFILLKKYFCFILLIISTLFLYSIVNFPSGSLYCVKSVCGYYFWGSHAHDGIWHIAIVENAFKTFPFQMPTFSEASLSGYNYLYDLGLFVLSKLGIPPILSYFKVVPIVWFGIYTFLLIIFAKKIFNNKLFIWIFLFFTFFTGSFSYYFSLIKDKTIWGSSGILAQLPQHILLNMQFAISLLILLLVLILLKKKEWSLKTVFMIGLLIFINIGLKYYGGFITYILVISYWLVSLIEQSGKSNNNRKSFKKTFINTCIVSVFFIISIFIFYNPISSLKTGSIFILSPFSFINPITEDQSLFYLRRLTDLRYAYIATHSYLKLILIELFNTSLFIFFYFGVRIFGIIYGVWKICKEKQKSFDIAVTFTILISIVITTFFIQKGEWTNIVQFLYYGIFLSTIYLAEFAYALLKRYKRIGLVIVLTIMILAVPATLDIFKLYSQFPGHVYISTAEYEALLQLKKMPDGIVLTPLYKQTKFHEDLIKQLKEQNKPLPIYAWDDTAYVSAISGKQQYIVDIWMERITGVDYEKRLQGVQVNDCSILKNINYVYSNNNYEIPRIMFDCPNKIEKIYGNSGASIYKVVHQ